ncbi:MFS transporter [Parahaliea aestuarii]|uniref:OFA family MFS transporter n=1 Tax=Parahaliea aestuarii TaxID=1852021 RepID=A0A5C8ZW49_9GAMM|nr:MFS transporter [Parahaliea aestuarii]TXS91790.1 OFA family MFS transporter [Parahaliea aestuarii]
MLNRWHILGIATVSQNLAIGFTFGSYGLLIAEIAETFSSSRSQVALGIALISVVMGLMAPALGYLLDRWSIRNTMILGALVTSCGFWLAAQATSLTTLLICFGIVVGIGITAMGVLPASKLAANWFPDSTGKALGIVSLPIMVALGPPFFVGIINSEGWRVLFTDFSLVYLLLIPFLAVIKNQPSPGQGEAGSMPGSAVPSAWSESMRDARLWILVVVAGIIFSGGIMLVTHIVQHAIDIGIDATRASLLLSVNGIAAMAGALFFGWLADRIGAHGAILVNLTLQAIAWSALLMQAHFPGLVITVAVLGLCGGGGHPAMATLVGKVFGAQRFGTLMGQVTLLVIPFNFGSAPLAGLLYDRSGSYSLAFLCYAGLCTSAIVLILVTRSKFRV